VFANEEASGQDLTAVAAGGIAYGKIDVRFPGKDASRPYVIQASINLLDWVTVGSSMADGESTVNYTEADSAKNPALLYRAGSGVSTGFPG
jgi:hypothetical protein